MSLSAADHRAAAELLAGAVAEFEAPGLARWLALADYRPRTNIAPGQRQLLIRARGRRPILDRATWGMSLRGASRSKLVINARAETVAERPMFRAGFARHRCLIPADGFFEWKQIDGDRQPHWFHRAGGEALLLAAVLDPPRTPDAPARFAVITRPAVADLRWIHDRMPVILDSEAVSPWLHGELDEARALLERAPPTLAEVPVSTAFNRADYDGPL